MACNKRCSRRSGEEGLSPDQQAAARAALDLKDMRALAGVIGSLEEASLKEIRLTALYGKPAALGAGLYGVAAA